MSELELRAEVERLRAENARLKKDKSIFQTARRIARWGLLITGPIFLTVALGFAINTGIFVRNSVTTNGTIVGLNERRDGEDGSLNYVPVFSYTASDGQIRTITSDTGSNPPGFTVGQVVKVLYETKNPEGAKLGYTGQLWLFPIVFGIIGTVFAATGYILLHFERRRDRRAFAIAAST